MGLTNGGEQAFQSIEAAGAFAIAGQPIIRTTALGTEHRAAGHVGVDRDLDMCLIFHAPYPHRTAKALQPAPPKDAG